MFGSRVCSMAASRETWFKNGLLVLRRESIPAREQPTTVLLFWNLGTWHGGVSNPPQSNLQLPCHAYYPAAAPIGFSLGCVLMFTRVDEAGRWIFCRVSCAWALPTLVNHEVTFRLSTTRLSLAIIANLACHMY